MSLLPGISRSAGLSASPWQELETGVQVRSAGLLRPWRASYRKTDPVSTWRHVYPSVNAKGKVTDPSERKEKNSVCMNRCKSQIPFPLNCQYIPFDLNVCKPLLFSNDLDRFRKVQQLSLLTNSNFPLLGVSANSTTGSPNQYHVPLFAMCACVCVCAAMYEFFPFF